MNQIANITANENALYDPAAFKHMADVAAMMVDSEMLPAHLRGRMHQGKMAEKFTRGKQLATAMVVLNAARLYQVDPFAFAQATFLVHGKLDFDGRTYAALANSRGGLAERLSYRYVGEGDQMRCICSGRFVNEKESRQFQTQTFAECAKRGGSAWVGCDPEQQLSYAASRGWVRRFCPDVLLGLVSEFECAEAPYVDAEATVTERGDVALLEEKPAVAIYIESISGAADADALQAVAKRIAKDGELTGMQKGKIREAWQRRQKELSEQAEPEPPAWLADCEAILHESDDPQAIENAWKKIEADSSNILPADSKRLGKLFNERMKEFVPGADQ